MLCVATCICSLVMSLCSRDFLMTSLYIHNNSSRLTVSFLGGKNLTSDTVRTLQKRLLYVHEHSQMAHDTS